MAKVGPFLQKYGVLVALIVLCTFNAFWQPGLFLKPENLRNLLNHNSSVGIVAVGMTLVIIGGGIDLSIGSLMAVSAALGVKTMNDAISHGQAEGAAVGMAFMFTLGAALLGGAINGLVITWGRVTPFIATLGGLVAYRSLTLVLASSGEIRSMSPNILPNMAQKGLAVPFLSNSQGQPLEVNWPIFLFFGVAILGGLLLNKTVLGRNIIAVGANEQASYLAGINTRLVQWSTYILMGLCAGLAGFAVAARGNSVSSSQLGLYYELDAIAAVAIGGTTMSGGSGRVWGTVVGVLILGIISNMLVISRVSPDWQGFVKGAIILLSVLIQRGQSERG